jgi:hypothetical protein
MKICEGDLAVHDWPRGRPLTESEVTDYRRICDLSNKRAVKIA